MSGNLRDLPGFGSLNPRTEGEDARYLVVVVAVSRTVPVGLQRAAGTTLAVLETYC